MKNIDKIIKLVNKTLIIIVLGIFIITSSIILINKISAGDDKTIQSLLPVFSLLVGSAIAGLISIANNKKESKETKEISSN